MFKNEKLFFLKKKMVKKCLYCNVALPDDSVIDFCRSCGVGVWGEKMLNAIIENMENARDNGDLCDAGRITEESK